MSSRHFRAALLLAAAAFLFAAAPANAQLYGGVTPVSVSAAGTTAIVTATLPAVPGKTNYICGLQVSAAGGTATVSPITVVGLLGGTMTYQGIIAGGAPFTPPGFSACIAASASNTAITVNTTANGTATAVNVSAWGYVY